MYSPRNRAKVRHKRPGLQWLVVFVWFLPAIPPWGLGIQNKTGSFNLTVHYDVQTPVIGIEMIAILVIS